MLDKQKENMKSLDVTLFKTLEHRGKMSSDYRFLKNLSEWIFKLSGNVNVTMRLTAIAERFKHKRK